MTKMKTTVMRRDMLEKEYQRPEVMVVSVFCEGFLCLSTVENTLTVDTMFTEDETGIEI